MEFVILIIGFILLIKAADSFVDSSVIIAKILKVPEIIIGATIVSIGTTLPETIVSAMSAAEGHGDLAYGNAIGSIFCNTALISGISLLFSPGKIDSNALKKVTKFFFGSFAIYVFIAYFYGKFTRVVGIILFSIFVFYMIDNIVNSHGDSMNAIDSSKQDSNVIIKSFMVLVVSAIVIAFASNLLIDSGTKIATRFGVPEVVIGLTIIALGTSLPELSTAVTSIIKGHSNLSIGNIVGANFFNIVTVTGIAAIVGPFSIPTAKTIGGISSSLVIEVPLVLIVMLILCVPSLIRGRTSRWQGVALLTIYAVFLIYQYFG